MFRADISKAFDSVAWSFLLELLGHLGFSSNWLNWIVKLLCSANTKVLLNGALGLRICHGRGLRQGDPLSPLLFIIVMDVFNALFRKAEEWSLLQHLGILGITHQLSLYADDVLFLSPVATDLDMASNIFSVFHGALGLTCNIGKCQILPIWCDVDHLELATSFLPCTVTDFPVRYLGVLLSVIVLTRATWQHLIDGMADRLPTWKGSLMHKRGRLALIKSTLAAMSVDTVINIELPTWVRKAMVKIMRSFLWSSTDAVHGGKCLMAWHLVQRLLNLGGSGIPDHRIMGLSLRLRWL
jgi:hypothetical protein